MYIWLFIAYVAGSITTYLLMYNIIAYTVTDKCIGQLIDGGFLKTKKVGDEIEILKND
jgi:hypothetical protein